MGNVNFPPHCHFKLMEWQCGDSDDLGNCEEWVECSVCGHTKTPDEVAKLERGEYDITDCNGDGCGECHVCKHYDFLEYFEAVAPAGSTRDHDHHLENYIKQKYG